MAQRDATSPSRPQHREKSTEALSLSPGCRAPWQTLADILPPAPATHSLPPLPPCTTHLGIAAVPSPTWSM